MKLKKSALALCAAAILGGCQSMGAVSGEHVVKVPFSVPLPFDYRSEIAVARYSELLARTDLPEEQQAQLYYDRGVLFDSLGMQTLARIDFNRAVKMKPDLAEVYNFLGIHHTLMQQYGKAYEMFDSVLELNEQHEYAYLNRGIALYYGNRPELASKDLGEFLARSPEDPYRVLWLYLAQSEYQPELAKQTLKQHAGALDKESWAYQLVALYSGEIGEQAFIANLREGVNTPQEYAQRLCEAYFYLGKLYQAQGKQGLAGDYFKLALATNVYEFVEYKYARLELDIMAGVQAG